MELHRPRSSSIPRQYHRIPAEERFNVTGAAKLKLKLQALNDKLDPRAYVHVETLQGACQSRPFHEEVYIDGSEEFFLLVKGIARADLIPDIYVEAYMSVQHGRYPDNRFRVSDFRKGVDPTFSEIRPLLSRIDSLCGTQLYESYRLLEDQVKPFQLLNLPAELRLSIYLHLLPREAHIAILDQPNPQHKPPRINLDILRANRQLHDEVSRYFYENRTLFMIAARDLFMSNDYLLRYHDTLSRMSSQTRHLFTKLEVQIGVLSEHNFIPRQHRDIRYVEDPMRDIFDLLPNLSTVVISFRSRAKRPGQLMRVSGQKIQTLFWLLGYITSDKEIFWDHVVESPFIDNVDVEGMLQLSEGRGSLRLKESVTGRLEVLNAAEWSRRHGGVKSPAAMKKLDEI